MECPGEWYFHVYVIKYFLNCWYVTVESRAYRRLRTYLRLSKHSPTAADKALFCVTNSLGMGAGEKKVIAVLRAHS